jgi:hypothetical protein
MRGIAAPDRLIEPGTPAGGAVVQFPLSDGSALRARVQRRCDDVAESRYRARGLVGELVGLRLELMELRSKLASLRPAPPGRGARFEVLDQSGNPPAPLERR